MLGPFDGFDVWPRVIETRLRIEAGADETPVFCVDRIVAKKSNSWQPFALAHIVEPSVRVRCWQWFVLTTIFIDEVELDMLIKQSGQFRR